jgi:hypothetical protein
VKALDLRTLPIFLDPNGYVAYSDSGNGKDAPFALYGMPITYLVSSSGSIVGYMPGAADWSTPRGRRPDQIPPRQLAYMKPDLPH